MGTLQLEGTEFAVTVQQSSELLILWKAYRSLIESDTAAQEELQALLGQVEKAMTTEQLDAIRDMEITQEEINELVEDLGLQNENRPEDNDKNIFLGGG
jgi:hypothetical protein